MTDQKENAKSGRSPLTSGFCVFSALVAGLLAVPTAQGFESREHRDMSDLAVKVALAMSQAREPRVPQAISALQAFDTYRDPQGSDKYNGQPIYGRITECVDFFLFPEKILAYGWKLTLSAPESVRPLSSPGGVPTANIPVWRELLEKCDRQNITNFQASHNNHSHFQQDLLMALRMWHLSAIAMAQRENNLYGGLLVNAIADHYLQDFFAPGHQVTPRDRLTDLPATATHDLANRRGALFRPYVPGKWPDKSGRPDLLPGWLQVLNFLCNDARENVNLDARCAPRDEIVALVNNPKDRIISIESLVADAQALRQGHAVVLRGDDLLGRKEQARQRLLMLAVQTASILDVVEGTNGLTELDFFYDMKNGQPYAKTNFGEYDFRAHDQPIDAKTDQDVATAPEPAAPPKGGSLYLTVPLTTGSTENGNDSLYKLRTRAPYVGVSLQRESHADGAYHARSLATVEAAQGGLVWNSGKFFGRRIDTIEVVPVIGYAYYKEGQFRGNGPTFRLSMSVPETEFSLSAYARWLSYPEANDSVRRLSYGIRADAGFSSYFTFFVTVGADHAVTAAGTLTPGLVVGSGIRIGAPLTRLNPP